MCFCSWKVANKATLMEVFDGEGCTLQLHQPQRFDDSLADLMMRLEAELGCLVGCNAYLTPKGTQGLAPRENTPPAHPRTTLTPHPLVE
jgi:lysine-specific demethylase/histidyl-hydroxylase NO66